MCDKDYFDLSGVRSVFFVGIGGIGMSSLAFICKKSGYTVAGSDRVPSSMTERLVAADIPVVIGHRAENIEGYSLVVYTGAVTEENPELAAAKEKGIPTVSRAAFLGKLMRGYRNRVGVAGMHGKSTATAMLSHLFLSAGREPTVVCGAETREMGGAYHMGKREFFLFEACEYKDSFLSFFPTVSVLLNMDLDHTDYFTGGLPQIGESFGRFARLPFEGDCQCPSAIVNADDEALMAAVAGVPTRITFGIENKADYTASDITLEGGHPSFILMKQGIPMGRVSLSVCGRHNVYNALAAAAVGDLLGLSEREILEGLSSFAGLFRRFEKRGVGKCPVYVDYAHHPREIEATLRAAREMTTGRLLCVFEPHTYSRTAALWQDFTKCFHEADAVFLLDIYAAREVPLPNITSKRLADETSGAVYLPSYEDAAKTLRDMAEQGDTVLILGAGTVERVADLILCE